MVILPVEGLSYHLYNSIIGSSQYSERFFRGLSLQVDNYVAVITLVLTK
jgi:hypothetical protein